MILLHEKTNPGGTSYTTPPISQGFSTLWFRMVGDSSNAGPGLELIGLRMNGDSGNNYRWQQLSATVTTATAAQNAGAGVGYIDCGTVPDANAAHAGAVSVVDVIIPRYRDAGYAKACRVRNTLFVAAASGGIVTYENSGVWMDTSAITTLTFLLQTGPFATATWIGLYGLNR